MDTRLYAIVDNILAGNTEAATPIFHDVLDDRALDAVEVKKAQVAATMFAAPETQET
jgi:hypothetical protein